MARLARAEVFAADEIAIVHVMNRVVRRCFLMGIDPVTGKDYSHRKRWVEAQLRQLAAEFGIDLICFAVLSNHFHLILRSRPDVVETWDDREIARRWLTLCPPRKNVDGSVQKLRESDLKSICSDREKLRELRSRLSDISWWMRLLCQRIAQRANREDGQDGKFWQNRFKAVRLLDAEALLACAAYVDLNPIRAALAETLEGSNHTSIQRRIESLCESNTPSRHGDSSNAGPRESMRHDAFLTPVTIDELRDALGPCPSTTGSRCSDKGFLPMSEAAYIELLDWTARQIAAGKRGATDAALPAIFDRLPIQPNVWCKLVAEFGQLFYIVAGKPQRVDEARSRRRGHRFYLRKTARLLLAA